MHAREQTVLQRIGRAKHTLEVFPNLVGLHLDGRHMIVQLLVDDCKVPQPA